ncbi:hypothetical protein Pint_31233 [Pistacia integerrima]|uniref:Uncharacterized protein n=1 Tax=Pistacia integerrima TaxID=434235 RepID=A0ACC0XQL4_9ROSI|nr:hypothetical protein Pint_31233 [Pistacia integerrima]
MFVQPVIKFLSTGRYIPDAAGAIYNVLKEMSQFQVSKKRRYEEQDTDLLKHVHSRMVTKETLIQMLGQHVEKVDYEMAMEYATQSGVTEEPRETIYLPALETDCNFIDLHSSNFVFRLIQ